MGERVSVEEFLEELEEDFSAASEMVFVGYPAEYDIRQALINQRKKCVLEHFRRLYGKTGQKGVNLPDATVIKSNGEVEDWRREDWDFVDEPLEEWDQ